MASYDIMWILPILTLIFVKAGWSLKCYNCEEVSNKNCSDPFDKNSTNFTECSPTEVCYKRTSINIDIIIALKNSSVTSQHVIADMGKTNIVMHRGCNTKDYCHGVKIFEGKPASRIICSICTSDLCNSSSHILAPFILGFLLFTLKEFFI